MNNAVQIKIKDEYVEAVVARKILKIETAQFSRYRKLRVIVHHTRASESRKKYLYNTACIRVATNLLDIFLGQQDSKGKVFTLKRLGLIFRKVCGERDEELLKTINDKGVDGATETIKRKIEALF
jgi:hypothetical protein